MVKTSQKHTLTDNEKQMQPHTKQQSLQNGVNLTSEEDAGQALLSLSFSKPFSSLQNQNQNQNQKIGLHQQNSQIRYQYQKLFRIISI